MSYKPIKPIQGINSKSSMSIYFVCKIQARRSQNLLNIVI